MMMMTFSIMQYFVWRYFIDRMMILHLWWRFWCSIDKMMLHWWSIGRMMLIQMVGWWYRSLISAMTMIYQQDDVDPFNNDIITFDKITWMILSVIWRCNDPLGVKTCNDSRCLKMTVLGVWRFNDLLGGLTMMVNKSNILL